jgi:hypothetical protein
MSGETVEILELIGNSEHLLGASCHVLITGLAVTRDIGRSCCARSVSEA